jgi:ornithine carbamoyltransferase
MALEQTNDIFRSAHSIGCDKTENRLHTIMATLGR